MNKRFLLPKLAFVGIKKNGITYFPYMLAGIFSVFVFFVFSSIMNNELMKKLPHSAYLVVLMGIGLFLLGVILVPFLLYSNSFLIKRRKLELGLYSILGLEKKHIAIMMFFETMYIFLVIFTGGIILGVVFSKLLFLVLLNLTRLPVDTGFTFSFIALKISFYYFVGVSLLNLIVNLVQVFKSNPNDLMKGAKSGEKPPKRLWISALLGIVLLAAGYYIAIISKVDSGIFTDFLLAVALVVLGTHFFFKAGILALLRILKGNRNFYYRKANYTTISGMLYRMKKSAASLANICIFSTMTIITLLCTAALWFGTSGVLDFQYPFDFRIDYKSGGSIDRKGLDSMLSQLSGEAHVNVYDKISYAYMDTGALKTENKFAKKSGKGFLPNAETIKLITLQDYNRMERQNEELGEDEVLVYSTGADFGFSSVLFGSDTYTVKKELAQTNFDRKSSVARFGQDYYFIVKDQNTVKKIMVEAGNPEKDFTDSIAFQVNGEDKNKKEFANLLSGWFKDKKEVVLLKNGIAGRDETVSMNGGLLFLGIFFGIIFSMCLLLIMYYKQITEGFDDRDKFSIMQKVGMSDPEVRGTIKRQILLVFFLPLVFAVLHTLAGFGMITELLGVLFLYNRTLIIATGVVVSCIFAVLYGLSYIFTSKVYYSIVRQMN
ncbi:ABC transporter permease [Ruminiclostridium cellobioparum]|uniref:ABC transporter permease n=1 Tax=Ruminiclostridium cellobioparum TaxID=29355 RepID=UPI0028A898F1|nr:FtsX-like permease family protein [Ruminiclostridium cellobioparum]